MGNIAPDSPSIMNPNTGNYDTYMPLYCNGDDINGDNLIYEFRADYYDANNDSVTNINLNNNSDGYFEWYVLNLPVQNDISLRCRSFDGSLYGDWINSTGSISIRHGTALQMFSITPSKLYYPDNKLLFNLYCKISNEQNNTKIVETWADCNNDGQWDYVFNYNNLTTSNIKVMKDPFKCIFDEIGNYSIVIGCLTEKINTDLNWNSNLCPDLSNEDVYCNIAKKYDVSVNENPFKFN